MINVYRYYCYWSVKSKLLSHILLSVFFTSDIIIHRYYIGFGEKLQIHNIDNCQVPLNECNEIELTHYQNQGECVCVRL